MRKIYLLILLVFPLLASSQQIAKNLTYGGTYIGFWEYKPADYSPSKPKYPLIIFLHGLGERGNGTTDLVKVKWVAIPKYIDKGHKMQFSFNGKTETFLVLSPQLSLSYSAWQPLYVDAMIDYAIKNLNVDPNRIILTGLSLGGGGVWNFASSSATRASKLAAISPVCGTCGTSNAANIANSKVAVWAFHSKYDTRVTSTCATTPVNTIKTYNPAIEPMITLYNSGNHSIWDWAYDDQYRYQTPNIWEWFVGQNRSLPANQFPRATAGSDISITTSTATATLRATASDPDGSIVRYAWKKIAGPAYGTLRDTMYATATASGLTVAGTYQYQVTVVDNRGSWVADTVKVIVGTGSTAPNISPVAKAGNDVTITLPTSSVTLNGSGSTDSDGSIASYSWSKLSGPTTFTIASPSAVSTSITNLVQGVYTFRLLVKDNKGAVATDDVVVTVNGASTVNVAPVAKAGADQLIQLPTSSVNVNGSGSADSDGSIASYAWSKVSGPAYFKINSPSAASSSISGLVQGTYIFRLTVTDNDGAKSSDDMVVTVNAATSSNLAPVAKAGNNRMVYLPTNSTYLSSSGSYDSDGKITSYAWSKISGPASGTIASPNASSSNVTGLVQGTYIFRLTVTDDDGARDYTDVSVAVIGTTSKTNASPVAKAGNNRAIYLPTNHTVLSASGSYDPDGTISSYAWDKISGPANGSIFDASASSSNVTGLVQGTYLFRLTVTDNGGAKDYADVTVVVYGTTSTTNLAPVAKAGYNRIVYLPTNNTVLSGSGSTDPDGSIISYAWSKLSGPSSGVISTSSAITTNVINLAAGTYVFRLTVTDNDKATATEDVKVIVSSSITSQANNRIDIAESAAQPIVISDKLQLFPNPASSDLNLQISSENTGKSTILMYDVSGKMVRKISFNKAYGKIQQNVHVSDLKKGLYHVEIVINNKTRLVSKFVKQ